MYKNIIFFVIIFITFANCSKHKIKIISNYNKYVTFATFPPTTPPTTGPTTVPPSTTPTTPTISTAPTASTTPKIDTGVGCGYKRMRAGEIVRIQSSNFGIGPYQNKESCIWRFFGHHCILTAECPCFSTPPSAKCFGDYLKISDFFLYDQKFCGDVKPQGKYHSATNNLRIKFRTDFQETDKGFLCYVYCTEVGKADPLLPKLVCP